MAITQGELLSKVKEGNIEAIGCLLNSKLKAKKIVAKLLIKQEFLHITLRSSQQIPEKPLVEFIQKVLASVEKSEWILVKVCSIREGEDFPDWLTQISLNKIRKDNIEKKAKTGDPNAIQEILDANFSHSGITTKVKLVNGQIQILLTGNETPTENIVIPSIQSELLRLEILSVTLAKVYGKCLGEDFPEWEHIITLEKAEKQEALNHEKEKDLLETKINNSVDSEAHKFDEQWLTNNLFSLLEKILFSPFKCV